MMKLMNIMLVIIGSCMLMIILDQPLSVLPYNPQSHLFYGEVHTWVKAFYLGIPYIVGLLLITTFILLFWNLWWYKSRVLRNAIIVVLLSLMIGPGLVVNVIFKNHWGRARPYQVIRDSAAYTPFWQMQPNHSENNSFPCGHCSIGFFLGVPLLAFGYRRLGLSISIMGGIIIGIVRFLQGGHYLSDIVFSGIIVWIIAEIVNYLVYKISKLYE